MTDYTSYKIETVQLCVPVSDAPDGNTVFPNLLDCDNALHGKGYKRNTQTISFSVQPTAVKGDTITLSATASSGLPVTFSVSSGPGTISGSTLTVTDVGTVSIAATQGGNRSYLPAIVVQQMIVSPIQPPPSQSFSIWTWIGIAIASLAVLALAWWIYRRNNARVDVDPLEWRVDKHGGDMRNVPETHPKGNAWFRKNIKKYNK